MSGESNAPPRRSSGEISRDALCALALFGGIVANVICAFHDGPARWINVAVAMLLALGFAVAVLRWTFLDEGDQ